MPFEINLLTGGEEDGKGIEQFDIPKHAPIPEKIVKVGKDDPTLQNNWRTQPFVTRLMGPRKILEKVCQIEQMPMQLATQADTRIRNLTIDDHNKALRDVHIYEWKQRLSAPRWDVLSSTS